MKLMSRGGMRELCDPVAEVFELLALQEVELKRKEYEHVYPKVFKGTRARAGKKAAKQKAKRAKSANTPNKEALLLPLSGINPRKGKAS